MFRECLNRPIRPKCFPNTFTSPYGIQEGAQSEAQRAHSSLTYHSHIRKPLLNRPKNALPILIYPHHPHLLAPSNLTDNIESVELQPLRQIAFCSSFSKILVRLVQKQRRHGVYSRLEAHQGTQGEIATDGSAHARVLFGVDDREERADVFAALGVEELLRVVEEGLCS